MIIAKGRRRRQCREASLFLHDIATRLGQGSSHGRSSQSIESRVDLHQPLGIGRLLFRLDFHIFVFFVERYHGREPNGKTLEDKGRSAWATKANEGTSSYFVWYYPTSGGLGHDAMAVDIGSMSRATIDNIAAAVGMMEHHGVATGGSAVQKLNIGSRRAADAVKGASRQVDRCMVTKSLADGL